jgi:putative membrane protein
LKQAAVALNIQVPAEPPRKAKKAEDKLTKLSGADFDRAYAKMAADEQKQTVKQFEREAKNGKVPGMKDFAAKNLSAEQERQKQAEELATAATGTAAREK